jgi:hypothetical protein
MTTSGIKAAQLAHMLLATRAPGATICPSEIARQLAASGPAPDWRALMPTVHAAVDALVAEGQISLSWKGKALAARDGPYRIGMARRGAGNRTAPLDPRSAASSPLQP